MVYIWAAVNEINLQRAAASGVLEGRDWAAVCIFNARAVSAYSLERPRVLEKIAPLSERSEFPGYALARVHAQTRKQTAGSLHCFR